MLLNCFFCGSSAFSHGYQILSQVSKQLVDYKRCSNCGSIRQVQVPDVQTLQQYYDAYQKIKDHMNPGYLDEAAYGRLKKERDMTFAEIGFDTGRIAQGKNLEFGCATGHFLRYLQDYGSKASCGVDMSKSMLVKISLDGVTLLQSDSLEPIEDASYDTIFAFNIMEHVADPDQMMSHIRRICKPDSLVVIEIPFAGPVQRWHGKKWRFFMPDEHLHIPSMRGFKHLLKKHGFILVGSTRFGSGYTNGSIAKPLKLVADWLAKRLRFGDRGTFLLRVSD